MIKLKRVKVNADYIIYAKELTSWINIFPNGSKMCLKMYVEQGVSKKKMFIFPFPGGVKSFKWMPK